ncbi:transposase [Streptomyces sp. NPDC014646]|uniref:transposase n=1 Tax=Streptomyces sp. NPDC014646 TaxID=3364877 RepID=UPI0036F9481D
MPSVTTSASTLSNTSARRQVSSSSTPAPRDTSRTPGSACSSPAPPAGGRALIDRRLDLPEHSWCTGPERRRAAGMSETVRFATEPRPAREMIAVALDAGVEAPWVTGDEAYAVTTDDAAPTNLLDRPRNRTGVTEGCPVLGRSREVARPTPLIFLICRQVSRHPISGSDTCQCKVKNTPDLQKAGREPSSRSPKCCVLCSSPRSSVWVFLQVRGVMALLGSANGQHGARERPGLLTWWPP